MTTEDLLKEIKRREASELYVNCGLAQIKINVHKTQYGEENL